MSKYTEEELNRTLADTGELLGDTPVSEEFSLDDILAEFGTGASARPAAGEPEKAQPEAAKPAPEPPVEEPVPEEPPAEEPAEDEPAEDEPAQDDPAEEPDAKERLVSVEDVMDRTVSAVMEEESAQRQQEREEQEREDRRRRRAALRRARLAAAKQLLRSLTEKKAPDGGEADSDDLGDLDDLDDAPPPVEEPSMDDAEFEQKRLCRRHRRAAMRCCIPAVLLAGVTAAEECFALPEMWTQGAYLRFGVVGGLLLVQALLALPLWRDMIENLQKKRFTCAWGALLLTLACLGDCAWCLLRGGAHLPLAGAAALVVFFCQWGVYLRCAARRESFRLADLGGNPPWGVEKTEAGAVKQKGRLEGFYTHTMTPDLPEKWQNAVLPLLLATACVLTGVVCLSGAQPTQPLWVLSALLAAAMPLAWPLAGAMPLFFLNRRLSHSGCAVAGYCGAKAISGAKRIVITDEDLFPAGTLTLNGMKIYGEELGRVLSYAVTVARAADSQALPILEQLLSDQGGHAERLDDFRWYEEGGAGGTIHGETVLLGSAYFMRRQKVRLPKELKVPSGLFLAVDGQLTAIFALRYQPSRNVDWALRTLRRNRITPVLAVRGSNLTPDFLRRCFKVDAKPIYPDVATRLSLLEKARRSAPAYALLYRDGLMPYAETVLGSRKLLLAVRWSTALAVLAAAAGLWLCYYLTGVGGYASLTPMRLVLFQLLWLVPELLLAGQVKHF